MQNDMTSRRGITLMEVMISIGILAIGLTSVLSIIPAGKSEVSRAIVYDRASALAANALADAATFGVLKPESLSLSAGKMAIFDPAMVTTWTGTASLKQAGIFSASSTPTLTADTRASALKLFCQGRDDVNYDGPVSDDALPMNLFPSVGPRAFQGRMTCLLAVTSTTTLAAGNFATLTAIVFHNRDLSASSGISVSGTWDGASAITPNASSVPSDRTLREVVRPGTVVFTGTTFHQLAMAAIDGSSGAVYVTFSGAQPANAGPVEILLDSVGLAQRSVMLEGAGPWSQ